MSDHDKQEDINFVETSMFQQNMKKAKRKQNLKYIGIGTLTTITVLLLLYLMGSWVLQTRLHSDDWTLYEIRGANFQTSGTQMYYTPFSAITETTYIKEMKDRPIVWDKKRVDIPMFGSKSTIDSFESSASEYSETNQRRISYNGHNNERNVAFYYPSITYEFLPEELQTATNLDENKIVEVALSFDQSYTPEQLEEKLDSSLVKWLWVDTSNKSELQKDRETINNLGKDKSKEHRHVPTASGQGAVGFQVNEESYQKAADSFLESMEALDKQSKYEGLYKEIQDALKGQSGNRQVEISGAVITGTPSELERYLNKDFIRASTIGATIDQY
ncbi:hypothetical protein GLW05_18880 [Pontibacillus yanchengensis]|uniref:Sigma factor regulator C-terminal domain-containing protein n=1 Tax=Pontibacillus yanchengensis TaxID=462910 RepID=A0A6I5A5J4_9BACI|nr:anti sigma factor C-terminal domain-containing protein [Pontibacillus yanchengensis]MYL35645.1 hypothetical protein [Pontibacillus yanchengensis]